MSKGASSSDEFPYVWICSRAEGVCGTTKPSASMSERNKIELMKLYDLQTSVALPSKKMDPHTRRRTRALSVTMAIHLSSKFQSHKVSHSIFLCLALTIARANAQAHTHTLPHTHTHRRKHICSCIGAGIHTPHTHTHTHIHILTNSVKNYHYHSFHLDEAISRPLQRICSGYPPLVELVKKSPKNRVFVFSLYVKTLCV